MGVAVGIGVIVCVNMGMDVYVALAVSMGEVVVFAVSLGEVDVFAGRAFGGVEQAVSKKDMVTRINKVLFISELLTH